MFLLQASSDIDITDEQELCDSPVERLQVRFLWTITVHLPVTPEADAAGALFSEMLLHFCEHHVLYGISFLVLCYFIMNVQCMT